MRRIVSTVALAVAALFALTLHPALAHDGHHDGIGQSEVIATLKKAHDQFHGNGGASAAKATLVALAAKLHADPTEYNKWVEQKVNAIVLSINGATLPDAEHELHDLIAALSQPAGTLTKPKLKARCMEFHDILHSGTPDAAKRCEAAIRAYVSTLVPDTGALSKWAQTRLNDILGAFAAGQGSAAEERLHNMIAAL
jgi:phage-related tail protein